MFFTFFWPFLGKTMQKGSKIDQKSAKALQKPTFCAFWGGARIFPTGSRLVPDFQKVVLEFAESGVKFWPEICRIGWFLRIWEVFWWVWGGWGLVWGGSGGFGGWFWGGWGGGLGVLGKFLVIFGGDLERWGKIFGDLEGLERFGGVWRDFEGWNDFWWFLPLFDAFGEHWDGFLFFEKWKCIAMLAKPTQSHVKHGRGHLHGAYHFFVLEPVCKVVMWILMITRSLRRPEKQ